MKKKSLKNAKCEKNYTSYYIFNAGFFFAAVFLLQKKAIFGPKNIVPL